MSRSPRGPLIFSLVSAFAILTAASHGASAGMRTLALEPGRMIVELRSDAFDIVAGPDGQRIIMPDFGRLMAPGQPELPLETYLIALPPAVRAVSVQVLDSKSSAVPGTFQIEPCPPMLILPGAPGIDEANKRMQEECRTRGAEVYGTDDPYPAAAAWLSGCGTLRKYSYAAVAFCPFTYRPESGRLEYHEKVDVAITFVAPPTDGAEARLLERLMTDRSADEKAARLFPNLGSVAALYSEAAAHSSPPQATYDYVIITTAGLAGAINASGFVGWKTSLGYSVRTVLTTDTEIAGQPGLDLAERIRNFLRSSYAGWGIQYVLLVGDYATVPMRICYPDPSYHVYDPNDPGLVAPGTPTDYYYADLSYTDGASWDLDGDGYPGEWAHDHPDYLAEVSVGRVPVNDPTRITYTLNKFVSFEQDTGAWKSNVLDGAAILFFANQDYEDIPLIDGAACLDSIETALMGGRTIRHYSEHYGRVVSSYPWLSLTEPIFSTAWRTGQYGTVNWSGHGWSNAAHRRVWATDDGDGVPESGNGELVAYRLVDAGVSNLDDNYPSVVFAISCDVGYPEPNPYGNLGIDLLTRPGWGAAAGIVSATRPSAISTDWRNEPGGTEQICYEFNRYGLAEGERLGDALYDGKFFATINYGWDHYYEPMNLYNFNLYGDPAMRAAGAVVDVAEGSGSGRETAPRLDALSQNPFGSSVSLRLTLPAAGPVRVTVHDVTGRVVATLADGTMSRGSHALTWAGTGGGGDRLASGLYFVVARAGHQQVERKVLLLR